MAQQAQPALNPQDVIPFDAAVRTTTLPNGVKVFIRHNEQPAKRVALRLAVKAGSINEADDQQGLAHLIEHMAFNGSAHFKPGELISTFEIDRREARTARQRVHELRRNRLHARAARPTSPTSSPKGLTAMADFAGGLTLDPVEIDKERGVVIEEWRGGLGARIAHPRQAVPGAVLSLAIRGAAADRQAGDHPQRAGGAAARVLRHLVPARSHGASSSSATSTRSRSSRASGRCSVRWLRARRQRRNRIGRCRFITQLLVNVATDPELTRSNVQLVRKRRARADSARRGLSARPRRAAHRIHDRTSASRSWPGGPTRNFSAPGAGGDSLSRTVDASRFSASVQDGKIADGLSALVVEAKRVRQFGFVAGELDRAKALDVGVHGAGVQRTRQDRERLVRAGVPQLLPRGRAVARASPTSIGSSSNCCRRSRRRGVDARAHAARRRQPRAARHVAAESRASGAVGSGSAGDARRRRISIGGHAVDRHDGDARPGRNQAGAGRDQRRAAKSPASASRSSDLPTASRRG